MTLRCLPLAVLAALLVTPSARAEVCGATPGPAADVLAVLAVLATAPAPADEAVETGDSAAQLTNFESLYATPKLGELPASFGLPSEFVMAARFAMNNSFPRGRSQEQGGLMVKDKDDKWVFRRGGAGQSAMWQTNHDDKQAGNRIYALFHTHPYDHTEGNITHASFSGQDIALLLVLEEPITVIQSGTGFFAMARSKEFQDWNDRMSRSERDRAFSDISAHYDVSLQRGMNQGMSFKDAMDFAAKQVALKYKLGYYAGEQGQPLKRIDVTK